MDEQADHEEDTIKGLLNSNEFYENTDWFSDMRGDHVEIAENYIDI